jgi:peroxiredoxin
MFFAAPEVRGAHSSRGPVGRNAGAARVAALAVALFLSGAFLNSTSGHCAGDAPPPAAMDKPFFRLIDTAGAEVSLAAFSGRDVVVHFFATWCEPCREELPALDRLVARARDRNVAVVAISVAEVPIRVRRFREQTPVGFPILLDQDRAVAKAWGVTTLPTSFVLDADLKMRFAVEHEYDWDRFDSATPTTQQSSEGRQ